MLKLIENVPVDPTCWFGNVLEISEKVKPFSLHRLSDTTCSQKHKDLKNTFEENVS